MKSLNLIVLSLIVTAGVAACGDDETATTSAASTSSTTGQGGSATATTAAQGGSNAATGGGAASGGMGAGGTGSGGAGGMACAPPTVDVDANGCVTFQGGSQVCGSASDDSVCNAAMGCGLSTGNLDQCHIDCEQGVVVGTCYTQADADCVYRASVCNPDCAALAACNWPFF